MSEAMRSARPPSGGMGGMDWADRMRRATRAAGDPCRERASIR